MRLALNHCTPICNANASLACMLTGPMLKRYRQTLLLSEELTSTILFTRKTLFADKNLGLCVDKKNEGIKSSGILEANILVHEKI